MIVINDKENDTPSSVLLPLTISRLLLKLTSSISNSNMVKRIHQDRLKQKFIKISTKKGGSTMKVFGDELNPSIPYKTFLLSAKDTAEWIVKEMLVKYGLKHENPHDYCLIQIIIPLDNKIIKEMILHDKDCPLNIYLNHLQKNQESIVFKVRKCSPEHMQIRQQLLPNDRILPNHLPMLIEVHHDGTNIPTPRVFKLHPNTTYIGCNVKTEIGSQYICVNIDYEIDADGINPDHCTIENQNRTVTVIPHGEIWYNGKLLTKPFILQHGALICFGRNSNFRYYDQNNKSILTQIKQPNENKLSMYTSLPALPMNQSQPEILQKKISATNIVNSKTKFNILPGLLEVSTENENRFLQAVFDNYPLNNIHFRLIPVYTLYMTLRHRLSPFGKANISTTQKYEDAVSVLHRIENIINKKIEECREHVGYLTYWLANTSELIDFLKQDRDLSKISSEIQLRLIKHIQTSFSYLTNLLQNELDKHLIVFTNPQDIPSTIDNLKSTETRWILSNQTSNNHHHQSTFDDILSTLSSIIDLFRKSRVNPGLTIEIFSQLFHYINTWLFNRIVCCPELKLCSHYWGAKIFIRLKLLHNWSFQQGLELPCEYHLMKINQLCLLLQSEKHDLYDIQQLISMNTFQINSIQITEILKNYIREKNEPVMTKNFSQALLAFVYKHVDEQFHRQGWDVQLAEETNLNVPFYVPDDGYSWENLRGIPQQLFDFIEPINRLGLCRLYTNSYSVGLWTQFMQISKKENPNDRIETIVLNKKNNSLGLNIVSAKNESQQIRGIYIKGIIPGSAADDNGHIQSGDQILRVDQISLHNASQEQATEILKQCGPTVTLRILKNAANQHGLSPLFSSSSKTPPPLRSSLKDPSKSRPLVIREDIPPKSVDRAKSLTPPKVSPQTNGYHHQDISQLSNDFDEKLKRRLEQFEHERELERTHMHQTSTKRQAEIEARLQKDREREIHADHDMKKFQIQRMSEQDQILEAKKEQARLLKHVHFPITTRVQRNK